MTGSNPGFAGMDPTQAGRELARWAEQLQRKAETFQNLQQQMARLSATATSPDGAVRVTVDSQGVPTDLTVTERGRGADPASVSARLMSCLKAAQAQLTGQVEALVHDTVPDEQDPDAARVIAGYRDRFPEGQEDTAAQGGGVLDLGRIDDEEPPPKRPRWRGNDDEDGWGDQPILR